MKDFVKLFFHPDHGQILLTKCSEDDSPSVKLTVQCEMGLASTNLCFTKEEDRDFVFESYTQDMAFQTAGQLVAVFSEVNTDD